MQILFSSGFKVQEFNESLQTSVIIYDHIQLSISLFTSSSHIYTTSFNESSISNAGLILSAISLT